jgi:hypothetical protein
MENLTVPIIKRHYIMIKFQKILVTVFILLLFSNPSFPQDKRTTETKVADLLARLPAADFQFTDKLMGDMLLLGEPGIKQICDQIIPAGTGDDLPSRVFHATFPEKAGRKRNRCGKRSVSVMPPVRRLLMSGISL